MNVSVFMSLQGVSTIRPANLIPSAAVAMHSKSELLNGFALFPSLLTTINSTVTVTELLELAPEENFVFRLNRGKARATAQAEAKTFLYSQTI